MDSFISVSLLSVLIVTVARSKSIQRGGSLVFKGGMSALYSSESSRGWVSFSDGIWEECDVVNSSSTQLSLRMKNGEVRSINRSQALFCYRNPSALESADDFLTLPNLDEPNILHSLRVRYWAGHVYSNTGPILIAVNPWRSVDIYNINVLEAYKAGRSSSPHIFGLATKAFRALMSTRNNQCVLISGESGAGKTESTKYVLQVLTAVGENRTGASASIEQQVMLTNPGQLEMPHLRIMCCPFLPLSQGGKACPPPLLISSPDSPPSSPPKETPSPRCCPPSLCPPPRPGMALTCRPWTSP